ncbi:hypothetical protein RHOSPDRAFT_37254 [Rhodotorula sp. JG-1b]|nr:hypothetical protein RHOSPDRAFT_37254 [Rhodotorula sp. JG-1b]
MTPAGAIDSAQLASSSSSSLHAAPPGPGAATSTPTTTTTPTTTLPPRGTQLVQQNVEMLSLPTRDSPAYYDSTSSAGSDSDLSDFAVAEMDRDDDYTLDHLAVPSSAHPVPTTNRGHKLSRLAPHTRRGKLGHYPNADAGFAQDAPGAAGGDLSAGAVLPAHKRRKLNDVAPYASEAGFPVAPNLHLVPRPVHSLSRESDHPATAYLPPVPQSPLDLLLMPSVQHTLGKKNQTFHLLGASATALIEQEAELINALAKVCRDLRGEGFEWRWQGDEGRRLAKQAAKDEEERKEVAREAETAAAAAAAATEANEPIAATPAVSATPADTQATPAPLEAAAAVTALATPSETPAATNAVIADLKNGDDDVKLELATPVLQSAVAPALTSTSTTEERVAVPGVSGADQGEVAPAEEEDTEMRSAEEGVASAEATPNPPPATATANPTEPARALAVTAATLAQGTDSGAGGSAPPPSAKEIAAAEGGTAAEGARASAPPATTTTTTTTGGGEVPAIAVTGPGLTSASAATNDGASAEEATPAAVNAAPGGSAESTAGAGAGAGAGGAAEAAAAEGDETATAGEATPAPSTAGGDEAAGGTGGGGLSASNAAAAAARRRSGRVPATGGGGRGGGGSVRHTRSRQSSPEDEGLYTSAGEDDPLLYDDEAAAAESAAGGGGRRRGGGGAGGGGSASGSMTGARAQLVPEEELPEYAERMIDPEGYVRSLFVTEDKVELERLVPAPTGGMVGTGQFDSLTPNEQEVLLHDCMTDLHRFLADALEYRNRLSEIRDGILGVERRRKGMWKVVRTVANDFLAEEEGAVYGQQQQQQQQDGGAAYD